VAYWNGSGWVELDRLLDDESAWEQRGPGVPPSGASRRCAKGS
jgi:hypothetical protein